MNTFPYIRHHLWALPAFALILWLALTAQDSEQRDSELPKPSGPNTITQAQPSDELLEAAPLTLSRERSSVDRDSSREPSSPTVETPGQSTLSGQVLDPNGTPVPGARVALLELDSHANPAPEGNRALVKSASDGRFELAVPDWALGARVLWVARSKGWRPFSRVLSIGEAALQQHHLLTLEQGQEITGGVVCNGEPTVETHVYWDVLYGTPGIHGVGEEAWWQHGRFESKHGVTYTDELGEFRITGLGPGPFRLYFYMPGDTRPAASQKVYSSGVGEYRVYDLSPGSGDKQRPSLTLHLPGAQAAGLDWVQVTAHLGVSDPELQSPVNLGLQLKRVPGSDYFHAPRVDLNPGEYLMVLGPSSWNRGVTTSLIQPRAMPVVLPAVGELGLEFELGLLAGFEIEVTFYTEEMVEVFVEGSIRDGHGRRIAEIKTKNVEWGGVLLGRGKPSWKVGQLGWAYDGSWRRNSKPLPARWGVMPAGSYILEVKASGFVASKQSIVLKVGELLKIPVELDPEE